MGGYDVCEHVRCDRGRPVRSTKKLQGPEIDQRNAPSRWQKMPILAPEHAEVRGTYASHCEVNHVIIRETSSRVSDWSLTTV